MARQGKLVLPAPEDAKEVAAVIVDPHVAEPLIQKTSRPEIIADLLRLVCTCSTFRWFWLKRLQIGLEDINANIRFTSSDQHGGLDYFS
jgi:hypothetical protein